MLSVTSNLAYERLLFILMQQLNTRDQYLLNYATSFYNCFICFYCKIDSKAIYPTRKNSPELNNATSGYVVASYSNLMNITTRATARIIILIIFPTETGLDANVLPPKFI